MRIRVIRQLMSVLKPEHRSVCQSVDVGQPHCDGNVLHAPGECRYCDAYPDRQRARIAERINFTGHHDSGLATCPAERNRPLPMIEAWYGNVAQPPSADDRINNA